MEDQAQNVMPAIATLAKIRGVHRRAETAMSKAYRTLEGLGFSKGAVQRALDLMDTDAAGSHEEMLQAQRILRDMRSPVQLEMVSMYENPVEDDNLIEEQRERGYFARFSGASRTVRISNAEERAAWMQGWDEADALLGDL